MLSHLGRVGCLRNVLTVVAGLVFAGAAGAAEPYQAREFTFPDDGFAISDMRMPEISRVEEGRIYNFGASGGSGGHCVQSLLVSNRQSDDARSAAEIGQGLPGPVRPSSEV